jgi:diaminohydroxyphosphoribosylaminopyrimidine deaminase/5-amino-6-(5-phosphoribosylamino)uracil reductase
MDAVIVGARTALLDDPRLTARPSGLRTPVRIVVDRDLLLSPDCRLLQTVDEAPVLLVTSDSSAAQRGEVLRHRGAEVLAIAGCPHDPKKLDPDALMLELGRRQMTNVLVEGGGGLLGSLFDRGLIDRVHVYLTPKLVGGSDAVSPLAGLGLESVPHTDQFVTQELTTIDGDVYWQGMLGTNWWTAIESRLGEQKK